MLPSNGVSMIEDDQVESINGHNETRPTISTSLVHVDVLKNREQSLRVVLRDVVGFRKDIEAEGMTGSPRGWPCPLAVN